MTIELTSTTPYNKMSIFISFSGINISLHGPTHQKSTFKGEGKYDNIRRLNNSNTNVVMFMYITEAMLTKGEITLLNNS